MRERGLETTDAFLKFVFIVSSCVVYFIVIRSHLSSMVLSTKT